MVRHTRRQKVLRKRTKKQHGGAKLGNLGAFGALFAKRGESPSVIVNRPINVAPVNAASIVNDPLIKYKKMLKMVKSNFLSKKKSYDFFWKIEKKTRFQKVFLKIRNLFF